MEEIYLTIFWVFVHNKLWFIRKVFPWTICIAKDLNNIHYLKVSAASASRHLIGRIQHWRQYGVKIKTPLVKFNFYKLKRSGKLFKPFNGNNQLLYCQVKIRLYFQNPTHYKVRSEWFLIQYFAVLWRTKMGQGGWTQYSP